MWIIYYTNIVKKTNKQTKQDKKKINSVTFYVNFHPFQVCLCCIVVYFTAAESRSLEGNSFSLNPRQHALKKAMLIINMQQNNTSG